MPIEDTGRPASADLSRLRIRRDEVRPRRWIGWIVAALIVAAMAGLYPVAVPYIAARRAPEVEIARATRVVPAAGGSLIAMPVLVASGYVIARRSADVGGKVGGRISYLASWARSWSSRRRSHWSAGVIGCLLALAVHGMSTGTTNWTSFSEVAFKFRITPALLLGGLVFAAIMGVLGGLLPAIRAARTPIARALREI